MIGTVQCTYHSSECEKQKFFMHWQTITQPSAIVKIFLLVSFSLNFLNSERVEDILAPEYSLAPKY